MYQKTRAFCVIFDTSGEDTNNFNKLVQTNCEKNNYSKTGRVDGNKYVYKNSGVCGECIKTSLGHEVGMCNSWFTSLRQGPLDKAQCDNVKKALQNRNNGVYSYQNDKYKYTYNDCLYVENRFKKNIYSSDTSIAKWMEEARAKCDSDNNTTNIEISSQACSKNDCSEWMQYLAQDMTEQQCHDVYEAMQDKTINVYKNKCSYQYCIDSVPKYTVIDLKTGNALIVSGKEVTMQTSSIMQDAKKYCDSQKTLNAAAFAKAQSEPEVMEKASIKAQEFNGIVLSAADVDKLIIQTSENLVKSALVNSNSGGTTSVTCRVSQTTDVYCEYKITYAQTAGWNNTHKANVCGTYKIEMLKYDETKSSPWIISLGENKKKAVSECYS
jgi:hypothetical protein